ncbi:hypothetical protein [Actinocrispum wychmicini]|uniref:Uncharacterized protein n=1 Tax=Actinocrispum wychmicini TaxID=1213861 RepID=A0A4V2S407_9PSEU|nr:hypothetical protein [Actinocrispum wychmicini]TCO46460.1 hypothetical protein EV192_11939 [Actinocrispum wychmicini]
MNEADPETSNSNIAQLPTIPCSVVWSKGHAYVLEMGLGRSRWVGCDDRGRPQAFTHAELESRGWTRTRRAS